MSKFITKTALLEPGVANFSKFYTCPRTTGCKKALVRTKALLARTHINTKARFVKIMI